MIQYLPPRFVVKEHKPMISGRLCMNCSLKHLLSMHIVFSIDTLSLTLPAADWKQRRCCLQAPADLCDDWLFYRMCCWVNAGMDCMCLMKIAIDTRAHIKSICSFKRVGVLYSTLQHSHALKWTAPGISSCSDCLCSTSGSPLPTFGSRAFNFGCCMALMFGTACLLPEVTSARPSLATFRTRVKTFLFMESYPDVRLIWHFVLYTQCLTMACFKYLDHSKNSWFIDWLIDSKKPLPCCCLFQCARSCMAELQCTAVRVMQWCYYKRCSLREVVPLTGQLADKPTRGQSSRGLDNSRTGQLADSEF